MSRRKSSIHTITDVVKMAGVSITTVSHVINKTRFVSEELGERVNAAIDGLNYQPSALRGNPPVQLKRLALAILTSMISC